MKDKERNKQIVETEIAKEEFLRKTETAKEEFLKKLAALELSASSVVDLLADMRHAIITTIAHRANEIKLSDIVDRNVVSPS